MNNENPFTITFGKEPNKLVSRYEDTDKIVSTFNSSNAVSQTFLIEGIRGSGKTVLMTTVAKILAKEKNWVVVNLNPTMDMISEFAMRLKEACSSKPEVLSKGFNISAAGFGIGINGEEKTTDHIGEIEKAFHMLAKKKKRVLITIDEVVSDDNMRIFASQFQIFVRQDYPVFLIMTGLYENIYEIQNDPSLTFLLRTPKIETEPLSLLQISRQYRDIFEIEEDKARELADLT
ncbi:MAG: ATP-binding protein, partial [Lachnospiraceae bacterium]|nr:ATP-binding protein [Lachnospiraceae bacterium]